MNLQQILADLEAKNGSELAKLGYYSGMEFGTKLKDDLEITLTNMHQSRNFLLKVIIFRK